MFWRMMLIMVGLLIIGLAFLLATTAGLKTALTMANHLSGDQVTIAANSVEGRLLGPLVLHQAKLETPGLAIELNYTELVWNPSGLLKGEIIIKQLIFADGQLSLVASEAVDSPSKSEPGWLPDIALDALKISSLQVKTDTDS